MAALRTDIIPPRVSLIDPRNGLISREWYRFFLALFNATSLGGGFAAGVFTITGDHTVVEANKVLLCDGTLTLTLPNAAQRDSLLIITNVGTGVITIAPATGETIDGDSSLSIEFQWTSIQLAPKSGGWVIV